MLVKIWCKTHAAQNNKMFDRWRMPSDDSDALRDITGGDALVLYPMRSTKYRVLCVGPAPLLDYAKNKLAFTLIDDICSVCWTFLFDVDFFLLNFRNFFAILYVVVGLKNIYHVCIKVSLWPNYGGFLRFGLRP